MVVMEGIMVESKPLLLLQRARAKCAIWSPTSELAAACDLLPPCGWWAVCVGVDRVSGVRMYVICMQESGRVRYALKR
jgi:hypothetical protein